MARVLGCLTMLSLLPLAAPATALDETVPAPEGETEDSNESSPLPNDPATTATADASAPQPSDWLRQNMPAAACAPERAAELNGVTYVPCGAAGVVSLRVSSSGGYEVVARYLVRGTATDVFVRDERVWVVAAREEAAPLDETLPAGPAAVPTVRGTGADEGAVQRPAPSRDQGTRATARVLRAGTGEVVVELGSADGLRHGSSVELVLRIAEPALGEGATREEQIAVGVVSAVSEHRATVRLGLNERVPEGAVARPTKDAPTAQLRAPPRASELWEAKFLARPILVLGDIGAGMIGDGSVGYRSEDRYHLQLQLVPLGFAITGEDAVLSTAISAVAAYDHPLFEVGLGLGGQTNANRSDDSETAFVMMVVQRARLGALDGFNLFADTSFALVDEEFLFSGIQAHLQIPLSRGTAALLRGGGGLSGYGFGEIGLRVLMQGNGDRGSFFLVPTLGYGAVFASVACDAMGGCRDRVFGGPLVGAGAEWRL